MFAAINGWVFAKQTRSLLLYYVDLQYRFIFKQIYAFRIYAEGA